MKRALCLSMAVAVVWGAVVAAKTAAGGAPAIHVPQPRHEFDAVPEGVEVSHDYVIRNLGGSDLEIQKVETG